MQKRENNYAYIDGANLHHGARHQGWDLDYGKFRVWLREKYSVTKAYLFVGYMLQHQQLYAHLRKLGYILVFKEVVYDRNGNAKGNCDADLVVCAMQDAYESSMQNAILVSSDGDFASLVWFLIKKQKIRTIISPYELKYCSLLLKRTGARIVGVADKRSILQRNK